MKQYYRVTGINLKRQPLGEADLLVTMFTREQGLLRAVAKSAKKPNSKLGGRLDLFVVNDLQIYQGKSLETIVQAQTLHNFGRLSRDLLRLGSAQYWAEAVLAEAVAGQAQPALFDLFLEHLGRLEACPMAHINGHLVHGLYQFLQVSGIAPVLEFCVLSGRPLHQEAAGFSVTLGGLVAREAITEYTPVTKLTLDQVNALQWLLQPELPAEIMSAPVWISLERVLRRYLEDYLQRSVRSAVFLETCLS